MLLERLEDLVDRLLALRLGGSLGHFRGARSVPYSASSAAVIEERSSSSSRSRAFLAAIRSVRVAGSPRRRSSRDRARASSASSAGPRQALRRAPPRCGSARRSSCLGRGRTRSPRRRRSTERRRRAPRRRRRRGSPARLPRRACVSGGGRSAEGRAQARVGRRPRVGHRRGTWHAGGLVGRSPARGAARIARGLRADGAFDGRQTSQPRDRTPRPFDVARGALGQRQSDEAVAQRRAVGLRS